MSGIYGIPETFDHQEPDPDTAPERHKRPTKAVVAGRDSRVYELVRSAGDDGISRTEVAASLGLTMHEAYLSLNRVQGSGRIRNTRRDNAHFWIAVPVSDGTDTGA